METERMDFGTSLARIEKWDSLMDHHMKISADLLDLVTKLAALAQRQHDYVEGDSWYSCPLAPGGCANDAIDKTTCTCGADAHNAEVAKILGEIGPSVGGEWQPIETAPKDGTRILVFWPENSFHGDKSGTAIVQWDLGYGECPWSLVECGDMATSSQLEHKPTHWMSLPEPPKKPE